MTDERDTKLLVEFCEWCRSNGIEFRHRDDASDDAAKVLWFLAARQPHADEPAFERGDDPANEWCKRCGKHVRHHFAGARYLCNLPARQPQACPHGLHNCAECHGGSSPEMPSAPPRHPDDFSVPYEQVHGCQPPAPQRFWFIYGGADGVPWRAYETDQTGGHIHDLSPVEGRSTRELAEADGRGSGLDEWKPKRD